MAGYTTTMTVWHDGLAHLAGSSIQLSEAQAAPLLRDRAIVAKVVAQAEPEAQQPTQAPAPEAEQPKAKARGKASKPAKD